MVGKIHTRLFRLTGGRLGARGGGLDHLLLTTTGKKSGKPRTVPLTYLRDGESFVLVASNGGSDKPPAWYHNLKADPAVRLEVGGRRMEATAREAGPEERDRLWPLLKDYNPFYRDYEEIADRTIPVIVCRPR